MTTKCLVGHKASVGPGIALDPHNADLVEKKQSLNTSPDGASTKKCRFEGSICHEILTQRMLAIPECVQIMTLGV